MLKRLYHTTIGLGRNRNYLVGVTNHFTFSFLNFDFVTYTTDRYGFAEHRDAWYQQRIISEITQLAVAIGVKVKTHN